MAAFTGSGRFQQRRAIPVHGLRPADLPGKPARHRSTCLSVHASKLYHMGFRQPVRRLSLADSNERRDWRIHAALAQRLITQARTLYVDEELGMDLTNTVYALDSTTIALCVSVFPWAHFRTTKAAVRMHTHATTCGATIPSCYPHLGWQAARRSCPRYALAGSRSHLSRGSCRFVDFAGTLCVAPSRGLLRHACQVEASMLIASIRLRRIARPASLAAQNIVPGRLLHPSGLPRTSAAHPLQGPRVQQDAGRHHQQLPGFRPPPSARSTSSRWQVELFFKWIKQHRRIKQFYGTPANAVKTQIWIASLGLRPRRHRQEAPRPGRLALHFVTDPLGDPLRENAHTSSTCGRRKQTQRFANNQPIEFIRFLTGH